MRDAKRLTVYSVVSVDNAHCEPIEEDCIGSWISKGKAIDNAVDYVMERIWLRPDIRDVVISDEMHPGIVAVLADAARRAKTGKGSGKTGKTGKTGKKWEDFVLGLFGDEDAWDGPENPLSRGIAERAVGAALRKHIRGEFVRQGNYIACADSNEFRFLILENHVEGVETLWTCVTSGKSDNDDEEFERPFPEVFMSKEEAVACAMNELERIIGESSYDSDDCDEIKASVRKNLKESGRAVFELTDGLLMEWNIWRTPVRIPGNEALI